MSLTGRIIIAIPMLVFGIFHFAFGAGMAGMVPSWLPGGVLWVYLTGAALIAGAVALFINKQARLAALLLAAFIAIVILTVHLPGMLGGNQVSMSMLLKDLGLVGGLLLVAHTTK
ncbi:MAG: DoxX family membrane protein [Bacteroidetes bacterium]|nr:DoxX family membrane protein [Bacteroidota bacterium]